MKKLFYRLILLALVGMLFAPFILKRENGQPILTREEFFSFDFALIEFRYKTALRKLRGYLVSDSESHIESEYPYHSDSQKTQYYRWQDEEGEWHFSDTPPANQDAESLTINNNQNIMKFDEIDKDKKNSKQSSGGLRSPAPGRMPANAPEPQSSFVKGIKNKLDRANSVQDTINEDYEKKSGAIN